MQNGKLLLLNIRLIITILDNMVARYVSVFVYVHSPFPLSFFVLA